MPNDNTDQSIIFHQFTITFVNFTARLSLINIVVISSRCINSLSVDIQKT